MAGSVLFEEEAALVVEQLEARETDGEDVLGLTEALLPPLVVLAKPNGLDDTLKHVDVGLVHMHMALIRL